MGALKSLFVGLALLAAAPAHADQVVHWRPYIAEASARCGVPVAWIERVMRAESAGMTMLDSRPITSRAGAMGLMQLMPGTWAELRGALGLGADPHEPRDNILAGTCYLRLMYDRFGYPGLFAAYNAGPTRYAAFLATGRTLPSETRAYLATVGRSKQPARDRGAIVPINSIFFPLGRLAGSSVSAASGDTKGIFVALTRRRPDGQAP